VLFLQLALGMPVSFALAAIAPASIQMSHDGPEHCPDDEMNDHAGMTITTHHALHSGQHAPSNHGCCHGGACQCHCSYPPAVSEHPSLTGPIAAFTHRLFASPAPFVAAPPGERFRPPIV
jgi:hypothetical protein